MTKTMVVTGNDREVITIRTFKEIETIGNIWQQLPQNETLAQVNADYDRYLSVLKATGNDVQPYVILIKEKSDPTAMVIARIEMRQISCRLGYLNILKPRMRCLSIIYGGVLGQPAKETSATIIRELMNILSRGEVDTIEFNHIRTESPIYQLSRKMPGVFSRDYFPIIEPHWVMTIPKNNESFYQNCSSSSRKQYKKCIRRLEREFPGQVRYQIYSQENDFDEAIKYVSLISEKTYQYSIGCGFVNNCFTRTLLQKASQKGWLRIHILFIGDEACAFEIWLRYKKTYFGHGIGFDPKWKKWSVGTVLFLKTIEILCADTSVELIDFGFGDADYKRSYADIQWQEASVYIFARRFYPVCVNILRTCIAALNAALEYMLNKSGLTNRIKRFWRNRLEEKASEKEF